MADEIIGEAAEATAAEGGAVILVPNPEAEAAEQGEQAETPAEPIPAVTPEANWGGYIDAHEERIQALEARASAAERALVDVRANLEGFAPADHMHPVDEDIRIVADELRALREEEVAPRRPGPLGIPRRGWLHRKLRGQSA